MYITIIFLAGTDYTTSFFWFVFYDSPCQTTLFRSFPVWANTFGICGHCGHVLFRRSSWVGVGAGQECQSRLQRQKQCVWCLQSSAREIRKKDRPHMCHEKGEIRAVCGGEGGSSTWPGLSVRMESLNHLCCCAKNQTKKKTMSVSSRRSSQICRVTSHPGVELWTEGCWRRIPGSRKWTRNTSLNILGPI